MDADALPEALVAGERDAEAGAGDGLGDPLLEGPSTDCTGDAESVPPTPPLTREAEGSSLGEPLPLCDSNMERLGRGEKEARSLLGEGEGDLVGECIELPLAVAQGVDKVDPLLLGGREGESTPLGEAAPTSDAEGAAEAVVDADALPEALAAGERDAEACTGDGLGDPLLEGLSIDGAADAEGVPPAPLLALPATDSEDRGDALRWDAE